MTAPQPDGPTGAELAEEAAPSGAPAVVLPLRPLAAPRSSRSVVRVLATAVVGPVVASYAAIVALVALLSVTADADWSTVGALRAAAPFWLAAHQVPLIIAVPGGVAGPLGVLPLLPTLGLAVLVARSAAGAAARLSWRTPARLAVLAGLFAGVHGLLGLAIALAAPLQQITAAPVPAFAGCAAVSGLAAALGGLRGAGFLTVALAVLPPWALRGVHAGFAGLAALLAAGALCTFGGLVFSARAVHDMLTAWSGITGGRLGVTVVSIAYLPNAVVAALSWTAGPGVSVGAVSVTLFGTTAGSLPAVPLLAALPEPSPAPWRVLVFALPILAGVLVGRHCRRVPGDLTSRVHAVVTAGAVAALACFGLAVLAGGRLGGGAFDPVRIPSTSLAIAVFVWLVLPATLIISLADRTSPPDRTVDSPLQPEAGTVPDVPSEQELDAELEPGAELERGAVDVEFRAVAKPRAGATPEPGAEPEPDIEPGPDAGPVVAEPELGFGARLGPDAEPLGTEPEPVVERLDAEPGPDAEPLVAESESDAELDSDVEAAVAVRSNVGAVPEAMPEPDVRAGAAPVAKAGVGTVSGGAKGWSRLLRRAGLRR